MIFHRTLWNDQRATKRQWGCNRGVTPTILCALSGDTMIVATTLNSLRINQQAQSLYSKDMPWRFQQVLHHCLGCLMGNSRTYGFV